MKRNEKQHALMPGPDRKALARHRLHQLHPIVSLARCHLMSGSSSPASAVAGDLSLGVEHLDVLGFEIDVAEVEVAVASGLLVSHVNHAIFNFHKLFYCLARIILLAFQVSYEMPIGHLTVHPVSCSGSTLLLILLPWLLNGGGSLTLIMKPFPPLREIACDRHLKKETALVKLIVFIVTIFPSFQFSKLER